MKGCSSAALVILCLLSLCPPVSADEGEAQKKKWTGSVNLGAALTTGSISSFSGNAQTELERAWEVDTLKLGVVGVYGRANGEDNANNQAAKGNWRHAFTDQLYSYTNLEFGRDVIQLIKWRAIANVGPGWRPWQAAEKRYLDLEAGVGYRHEEFLTANVDDDDWTNNTREPTRDDVLIRAAFEYADMVGEALELKLAGELLLPGNNPSALLARSDLVGAVPLVAQWFFRTSFGIEYQNEPAEGAKKVNTRLAVGLEYRF